MHDPDASAGLDALLPAEMARRAAAIGVARASMDGLPLFYRRPRAAALESAREAGGSPVSDRA